MENVGGQSDGGMRDVELAGRDGIDSRHVCDGESWSVVVGGVSIYFGHVIVVTVKMGLVEFSGPVATLLLNQKRKRGRLKNNTTAFIRQPSEAYFQKRIAFHASSAVRKTNSYLEYILL